MQLIMSRNSHGKPTSQPTHNRPTYQFCIVAVPQRRRQQLAGRGSPPVDQHYDRQPAGQEGVGICQGDGLLEAGAVGDAAVGSRIC